jgi:hypothetical protein
LGAALRTTFNGHTVAWPCAGTTSGPQLYLEAREADHVQDGRVMGRNADVRDAILPHRLRWQSVG